METTTIFDDVMSALSASAGHREHQDLETMMRAESFLENVELGDGQRDMLRDVRRQISHLLDKPSNSNWVYLLTFNLGRGQMPAWLELIPVEPGDIGLVNFDGGKLLAMSGSENDILRYVLRNGLDGMNFFMRGGCDVMIPFSLRDEIRDELEMQGEFNEERRAALYAYLESSGHIKHGWTTSRTWRCDQPANPVTPCVQVYESGDWECVFCGEPEERK